MFENAPNPISLIAFFGSLALIPFLAVMVTSFVKLAVVLSLVRNALGVQQIPPNTALYGLAIILTIYIMAPIGMSAVDIFTADPTVFDDPKRLFDAVGQAAEPFREFLIKHAEPAHVEFFVNSTEILWPEERRQSIDHNSYFVLIPAFTVSEMTAAFEIGFLLYLPFVIIDLVISNILLAMGMMMVSPMTISLPFKLFLFVVVDGWSRLIEGLVLSYQ